MIELKRRSAAGIKSTIHQEEDLFFHHRRVRRTRLQIHLYLPFHHQRDSHLAEALIHPNQAHHSLDHLSHPEALLRQHPGYYHLDQTVLHLKDRSDQT